MVKLELEGKNYNINGNEFIDQLSPEDFLGIVAHRSGKYETGNYTDSLEKNDLFTLNKLLIGPGLQSVDKKSANKLYRKEKTKKQKQAIHKNFTDYDIENALGIIGGYGVIEYGNNTIVQNSPIFRTIKLPGGKATKKELVYGTTLLRNMSKTKEILKELERTDRKNGGVAQRLEQLSYDRLKTIIGSFTSQFNKADQKRFNSLVRQQEIFKKFMIGLSNPTIQTAVKPLQEIYKMTPEGKDFLELMFQHVHTDEQKQFFNLERDIINLRDETFEEALVREIQEETGLTPEIKYPLGWTAEIKRIQSPIRYLDQNTFAIKVRRAYKVVCDGMPDPSLIKESPSEQDQENVIVNNRSTLGSLIDTINYSGMKTGLTLNKNSLGTERYGKNHLLKSKMNSQVANQLLITLGFLDDFKHGRITNAEIRNGGMAKKILSVFGLKH